jgi:hypothetical protein
MQISKGNKSVAEGRVYLHLEIRTSVGKRDLLQSFLAEAIPFYESAGDLKVKLLQNAADPNAFIEIIEYESQQALDRDNRRTESDPEMIQYIARWRSLLDKVEVTIYRDVTAQIHD